MPNLLYLTELFIFIAGCAIIFIVALNARMCKKERKNKITRYPF